MLSPVVVVRLQEICAGIIIQKNQGYDFGAWRDGIAFLGLLRVNTEELILANDSIFVTIKSQKDMLARFDYTKVDIWGLAESSRCRNHLQYLFWRLAILLYRANLFQNSGRVCGQYP